MTDTPREMESKRETRGGGRGKRDRQAGRQALRQAGRQADRQTVTDRNRHSDRERCCVKAERGDD